MAIFEYTTYTGKVIDLLRPDPKLFDIEEIAQSLSQINRFTGHTRVFFSVAQHSVLVSQRLRPEYQLQGLLHDAHEYITSDIARSVKLYLGDRILELQNRLDSAIWSRFGVTVSKASSAAVAQADDELLSAEAMFLRCRGPEFIEKNKLPAVPADLSRFVCLYPGAAYDKFMEAYESLRGAGCRNE